MKGRTSIEDDGGQGTKENIWEDNFKVKIEELKWEHMHWIHLAEDSKIGCEHFTSHKRQEFLM